MFLPSYLVKPFTGSYSESSQGKEAHSGGFSKLGAQGEDMYGALPIQSLKENREENVKTECLIGR